MKAKSVIFLLVVCCGLAVVAGLIFMPNRQTEQQAALGQKPFDHLPANEITAVTITSPESVVTLTKQQTIWVVANRFNYPADFAMIADLVRKIKALKTGRRFTASPQTISRLSLHRPDQKEISKNQRGVRIKLSGVADKTLLDIVIGKARETSSYAGGQYIMPATASTIYLVDDDFRYLAIEPSKWLHKNLTDIKAQDIEKVIGYAPGSDKIVFTLKRPEKQKAPIFLNVPQGKKLRTSKIENVFEALSGLKIEDIADPGQPIKRATPENTPLLEYYFFDGTVYHIYPGNAVDKDNENYYLNINISYQEPEIKPVVVEGLPNQKEKLPPKKQTELWDQAGRLNRRISPWTYIVSKWTIEHFITDPKEFFEP